MSAVKRHYDGLPKRRRTLQEGSSIIGVRNTNNYVKASLISRFCPEGARVHDLGCGRGGDVRKFQLARVRSYLGTDVTELDEARRRARLSPGFRFDSLDFTQHPPPLGGPFDVVSCQFAVHYAWRSEEAARVWARTASDVVKGGHLLLTLVDADRLRDAGGDLVEELPDTFEDFGTRYLFTLRDGDGYAVRRCPEYVVKGEVLRRLLGETGMVCVEDTGLADYRHDPELRDSMGAGGTLPEDQLRVVRLYRAMVFRRVTDAAPTAPTAARRRGPTTFPPRRRTA